MITSISELKQKDDENKIQFIKRVVLGKLDDKMIDIDYTSLSTIIFSQELSESECRKRCYALKYIFNLMDELQIPLNNNIQTGEDILNEIDIKKLQLETERKKIQTQRLEINRWIRNGARNEMIEEDIINAISNLSVLETVPQIEIKNDKKKEMIVSIADPHFSKQFIIKGLQGEIINAYDIDIFKKRMWKLRDRIIEISKKEEINHVHITDLGDDIENVLRTSALASLQMGVIDSVIEYAEFISQWLNELSRYVSIDYYNVLGNHTQYRFLNLSHNEMPMESFEKIINVYILNRLSSNQNVTVHRIENEFAYFKVLNTNVLAIHGQYEKNLAKSIQDYSNLYNIKIHMIISGHYHSKASETVGFDESSSLDYVLAPSVMGCDDYSMRIIKKKSRAGSVALIIGEDGKEITYDINLQII